MQYTGPILWQLIIYCKPCFHLHVKPYIGKDQDEPESRIQESEDNSPDTVEDEEELDEDAAEG